MADRKSGRNWTVRIKRDGTELFVIVDGQKIAKRGKFDSPEAGTWISLEPGWEVLSSPNGEELVVCLDGVRVH